MKKTLMVFIVLGLLCSYNISFGDIFKYTDNDGVIHLTNDYDSEPCKTFGCKRILVEKRILTPPKRSSVSENSSSDWVEYTRTEDGSILLYNKRNITKIGGKYIIQVWTKWIYSDEDREKTLIKVRNSGLSTEGWSKLSYCLPLYQIDCRNKKLQILSNIQYDNGGMVLHSGSYDKQKWDYIVPDSTGEVLLKKVCR
ncbi:MAG: surface-adhesin E family protein [Smithellaceae bacterium]